MPLEADDQDIENFFSNYPGYLACSVFVTACQGVDVDSQAQALQTLMNDHKVRHWFLGRFRVFTLEMLRVACLSMALPLHCWCVTKNKPSLHVFLCGRLASTTASFCIGG